MISEVMAKTASKKKVWRSDCEVLVLFEMGCLISSGAALQNRIRHRFCAIQMGWSGAIPSMEGLGLR